MCQHEGMALTIEAFDFAARSALGESARGAFIQAESLIDGLDDIPDAKDGPNWSPG
jgi:hypothetical protein